MLPLEIWRGANDHYKATARWAGYGEDYVRYAIEHDLTHHWLAECKGVVSYALYRAATQQGSDAETEREELLVNALQRCLHHQDLAEDEVAAIIAMPSHDFVSLVQLWERFS